MQEYYILAILNKQLKRIVVELQKNRLHQRVPIRAYEYKALLGWRQMLS